MGCHLPFCKALSGFSYLVHSFRRSHQSCLLGTCHLSSTSLLLAMPKCVGLNECTMPTILSNFRAGRHDGEPCQEWFLPQVLLLATFKSLIFIPCCSVASAALHKHYSGNTTKRISFCLDAGLSASSLYPRGRHQLE